MSPTEQLRLIASRIEGMRGIDAGVDMLLDRIGEASPIVMKRIAELRRENEEQVARLKREEEERAADLERLRRAALPYLDGLPDTMNRQELDRFVTMISGLPTEDLVRRRNAQNAWRGEDIPKRASLELACQAVSAEMVRRRRADHAGVTAIEYRIAMESGPR